VPIGADHEGAGGAGGTAPAGSQAPSSGASTDGSASAAGRPVPQLQQASAAFFAPQLPQVHSSIGPSSAAAAATW